MAPDVLGIDPEGDLIIEMPDLVKTMSEVSDKQVGGDDSDTDRITASVTIALSFVYYITCHHHIYLQIVQFFSTYTCPHTRVGSATRRGQQGPTGTLVTQQLRLIITSAKNTLPAEEKGGRLNDYLSFLAEISNSKSQQLQRNSA